MIAWNNTTNTLEYLQVASNGHILKRDRIGLSDVVVFWEFFILI